MPRWFASPFTLTTAAAVATLLLAPTIQVSFAPSVVPVLPISGTFGSVAPYDACAVPLVMTRDSVSSLEVNSETGRDVRRVLAAAVVNRGWGLLELRPLRMSLEEIFLHLTTEDAAAPAAASAAPVAETGEAAHE